MYTSLSSQVLGFLAFIVAGVLLGAVYDILRIWRAMFRSERRSVFFQDLFYMVLAAFFTFLVNLGVNYGELRLYLFLGEILGWFAWHYTVGLVTVSLFRRLFRFLYRKLFDPFGKFLRLFVLKIGKKLLRFVDYVKKQLQKWKKCLKHSRSVVYNQRKGKRQKSRKVKRKRKRAGT